MSKAHLKDMWNIRYIRFVGGGFLNLSVKIVLTSSFRGMGLELWINYALVQCIILLISYFYHALITFKTRPDLNNFYKFVSSVFILKLFDYSMVVIVNHTAVIKDCVTRIPFFREFSTTHFLALTIALSTAVIFIMRYFLFRKAFSKAKSSQIFSNKND